MSSYCDDEDVRLVCGMAENVIGSGDIAALIVYSDRKIADKIGTTFDDDVPTSIERLSALLTCIQIYSRPDLRFRLGQSGVDEQTIEKNLELWEREAGESAVEQILSYKKEYGKDKDARLMIVALRINEACKSAARKVGNIELVECDLDFHRINNG